MANTVTPNTKAMAGTLGLKETRNLAPGCGAGEGKEV